MITFRGAVLVATAVFTFLLARLTHVGWLYLLDAMLWGMILLSLALPSLFVMSLAARRRVFRREGNGGPPGPSEGEVIQVELSLENRQMWPRYFLSVSYDSPLARPSESLQRFYLPRLGGGSSQALVSSVRCHRRGAHQFGPVSIESKAPFGLFRRTVRLSSPLSVLVYPRVYPIRRIALLEGDQGGTRPQRRREAQEVSGSRPYVPGDPPRHVHWRNTARMGRPMVKEYEDSQENTLAIAFDSSRDVGQGQETVLEYSIKIAASVAGYVMERGWTVHVLTGRLPGRGMPWAALLKELALLEAGHGPGLVGSLPVGSRVLALVSEDDIEGLETLGRRAGSTGGQAVVVLQGFGDVSSQGIDRALETLSGSGAPVVRCSQGNLPEALHALEQVEWFTGSGVQRTAARLRS